MYNTTGTQSPQAECRAVLPDDGAPLPEQAVHEAIDWHVRLASAATQDAGLLTAFRRWRDAHPHHALAWQRTQRIGSRLLSLQGNGASVPAALLHGTLVQADARLKRSRRGFLKACVLLGGAGGGYLLLQSSGMPLTRLMADVSTRRGEIRALTLQDGTQLMLDTATVVDIAYSRTLRRIVLHQGAVMIASAHDDAGRPLQVQTREGMLTPVGTRFSVRRHGGGSGLAAETTQVVVTEGAVRVLPVSLPPGEAFLLRAGQQLMFTRVAFQATEVLHEAALAWTEGMLIAEDERLDRFLARLGHYRTGHIHCAREVAGLRITGVWPLRGSEGQRHILDSLPHVLPVRLCYVTRFWVNVTGQ